MRFHQSCRRVQCVAWVVIVWCPDSSRYKRTTFSCIPALARGEARYLPDPSLPRWRMHLLVRLYSEGSGC